MLLSLNPVASVWPKWISAPSKRLMDASNSATPQLSAHLEAVALNSDSEESHPAPAAEQPTCQKKKNKDIDPVNDDGFLAAINITSLSNDEIKPKHDRKGQDVDHFLVQNILYLALMAILIPIMIAPCAQRRDHELTYNKWALDSKFKSMLPKAVVKHQSDAIQDASPSKTGLDSHLYEQPLKAEHVLPYTDQVLYEAATEWLILLTSQFKHWSTCPFTT
ncbi:uncharacterized protein BJ212DRAFT_1481801 [Suillus subaureus]|uniref:Uncharacterized protein n=1 Tax=Suillus subaureus TaxID=48587 RepID=A0A9P7JCM8_9AGAM|nr:uncharacterized protein BJ212DRAFT_1481801 [Suillus subaureus]KAG1814598.1 hypothetical protein BJ212DRAFT_1481801 [Suillus subaureus]